MTTLDKMQDDYNRGLAGATHLLLIGHTKTGKSDYVAQAAKDGFQVIYIDRDNGLETLMSSLGDDMEAKARIHYFAPEDMAGFIEGLLTKSIFRHNLRTNKEPEFSDKPTDRIIEFRPTKIPVGTILAIDSWTTLCLQIIEKQAEKRKIDLMDVDKYSREIYGGTGFKATQIATMLQHTPFHVIVQAHPGYYERKEKPANVSGKIDEKDMIIRETTQVPISTSMPHGASIGKFFNQIGWLYVDSFDRRVLDFKPQNGRLGSGTPGGIANPRGDYRFSKIFSPAPPYPPSDSWMTEMTTEEMRAKSQKGSAFNKPKDDSPAPAATAATEIAVPKLGSKLMIGGKK